MQGRCPCFHQLPGYAGSCSLDDRHPGTIKWSQQANCGVFICTEIVALSINQQRQFTSTPKLVLIFLGLRMRVNVLCNKTIWCTNSIPSNSIAIIAYFILPCSTQGTYRLSPRKALLQPSLHPPEMHWNVYSQKADRVEKCKMNEAELSWMNPAAWETKASALRNCWSDTTRHWTYSRLCSKKTNIHPVIESIKMFVRTSSPCLSTFGLIRCRFIILRHSKLPLLNLVEIWWDYIIKKTTTE